MVEAQADLDLKDKDGYTALMWVARRGRMAILQMLIDAGARTGFMCRFFRIYCYKHEPRRKRIMSIDEIYDGAGVPY